MEFNSYTTSGIQTATSVPMCCYKQSKLQKAAFTLAEVLITLTIIGVVAAMTIPTLMSRNHKHQYATALKAMHAQLAWATNLLPIEMECSNGDYRCAYDEASSTSRKEAFQRLFKSSKFCSKDDTSSECAGVKTLENYGAEDGVLIIANGMQIGLGTSSTFGVDINGNQGPNKLGYDIFLFEIADQAKNGIPAGTVMPMGSKVFATYNDTPGSYWKDNNLCTSADEPVADSQARYCAGRVLEEGGINY